MDRTDLLAYLKGQRYGVLGSLSAEGEPQGALVGYAVTPALQILFDTIRSSRKYRNLLAHPRASFTVGAGCATHATELDERTVQFEGIAEELSGEALARLRPVYYHAWPDGSDREAWSEITWFVLHPLWIRYSDYSLSLVQEWRFPL